jgi:HK97 family phage major capsid protein
MTIAELRALRAKKIDAMSALVDKMNAADYAEDAADQAAYDAVKKEIADLETKIERTEQANKLKATLATPAQSGLAVPKSGIALPPGSFRSARLKNFKGADAEQRAFRFGKFMQASVFGNEKAIGWCRENGIEVKAHSEGNNTTGGYFVPEEMSSDIIDLRDSYGIFRRLCQVVPMGRDTITIPKRVSGLTAYAVGEGAAITASDTAWTQVRLTASKWGVLSLVSSELDEDAVINIGDMLVGEIAYAFALAEDNAGFAGTGSAAFGGITGIRTKFNNGVGSLAGAVDAASNNDTFAEITAADIRKLMATLPQYVYERGRPAFICSQVAWAVVFENLIGAAGGVTKDEQTGTTRRQYLGFPVEITPAMPTVQTDLSDVAMILFGDLGMAAALGDRRGITVARSTEYKFAEDQVAIKGTERFDINVHSIGDTSTAGPIVALMGE